MKALSEHETEILALADRLRAVPIDGVVTYTELDKVLGRPVRGDRYLLMAARRRVERDEGAIFQAVFNTGLKRLAIENYASVGQHARRAIGRKAKIASRRMGNGIEKANDAPAAVVRAIGKEQSILGLIEMVSKDRSMAKILDDERVTAPTPLGRAAADLMAALGLEVGKK